MHFFTSLLSPQCHICGQQVYLKDSLCLWCQREMSRIVAMPQSCADDFPWLSPEVSVCARYESWVKTLILSQKAHPSEHVTAWMAQQLRKHCPPSWRSRPVVWVPRRLFQPPHLVESLGWHLKRLGFDVQDRTPLSRRLVTHQAWRRQKTRNRRSRWAASSDLYYCRSLSPSLQEQNILLLDDVTTTGATIEACASLLKMAGAAHVAAIVFAATPNKNCCTKNMKGT